MPEKAIKVAKKLNNKDRRKLQQNCRTLSKVKRIQFSNKKCFLLPVIMRDLLISSQGINELGPKNNVRYREVSTRKCPVHRSFIDKSFYCHFIRF